MLKSLLKENTKFHEKGQKCILSLGIFPAQEDMQFIMLKLIWDVILMKRLAGIGIKIKYHMLFLTARKTARRRCDSSVAIISNNQFNCKSYFPELLFIKESSVKNPKDMYETCIFLVQNPKALKKIENLMFW